MKCVYVNIRRKMNYWLLLVLSFDEVDEDNLMLLVLSFMYVCDFGSLISWFNKFYYKLLVLKVRIII